MEIFSEEENGLDGSVQECLSFFLFFFFFWGGGTSLRDIIICEWSCL